MPNSTLFDTLKTEMVNIIDGTLARVPGVAFNALIDGDMKRRGCEAWTALDSLLSKRQDALGGWHMRIDCVAATYWAKQQYCCTVGLDYRVTGEMSGDNTAKPRYQNGGTVWGTGEESEKWQGFDIIGTAGSNSFYLGSADASGGVRFRDLKVRPVDNRKNCLGIENTCTGREQFELNGLEFYYGINEPRIIDDGLWISENDAYDSIINARGIEDTHLYNLSRPVIRVEIDFLLDHEQDSPIFCVWTDENNYTLVQQFYDSDETRWAITTCTDGGSATVFTDTVALDEEENFRIVYTATAGEARLVVYDLENNVQLVDTGMARHARNLDFTNKFLLGCDHNQTNQCEELIIQRVTT